MKTWDVFSCCVPSHLYLYLKGATTIKEAMENIKRVCALGGVSVQATPAPVETKTTPTVPFIQMNERQNFKTVSFKDDIVKEVKDSLELVEMKPIFERLTQVVEKQYRDSRSRRRERRDSRDRRSRSYDRSSSYDRSKSRERSSSRDRNSRSRGKNQNSREKRNNSGTRYSPSLFCDHCKMTNHDILHCYKLQKTLKKKGVSLNETNKKDKDDQERYQMFMDLENYTDTKDPTN